MGGEQIEKQVNFSLSRKLTRKGIRDLGSIPRQKGPNKIILPQKEVFEHIYMQRASRKSGA